MQQNERGFGARVDHYIQEPLSRAKATIFPSPGREYRNSVQKRAVDLAQLFSIPNFWARASIFWIFA